MESTYTDLALYQGKNLCARTDIGISPISEVCDGTVSLKCIVAEDKTIFNYILYRTFDFAPISSQKCYKIYI